jgi:hypothetical protein
MENFKTEIPELQLCHGHFVANVPKGQLKMADHPVKHHLLVKKIFFVK